MGWGYCGKILRVDLTREIIRDDELDENLFRNFLSGSGLGAKILFDEVPLEEPGMRQIHFGPACYQFFHGD